MPSKIAGAANAIMRRLVEIDAHQAALAVEGLAPEEAQALVRSLPETAAVECLDRMQPAYSAPLLLRMLPDPGGELLDRLNPDRIADILRALDHESAEKVLQILSPDKRRDVAERFNYPENSAGRLMRTRGMLSFYRETRVREAVQRIRAMAHRSVATGSYAYVVGPEGRLQGVLNMRDLLLAGPDAVIETIMHAEVFTVSPFTDREELVHIAKTKNFIFIPVVDAQGRLLGSVKAEDLLGSSEEEATEDLHLMFGVSPEERPFSSLRFKVSKRLPWLYVNLATAFLASFVVSIYQNLIDQIVVLAVFLPIAAGMGGNSGIQALAVTMRGLVTREVTPEGAGRLILFESLVGLITGVAVGVVTALAAWVWHGNPFLGVVIGLALVVSMVAAGFAGAGIPILMKRLGYDPALSSGIFLTTVTDVVGYFSFLGLASVFSSYLTGSMTK